MYGNVLASLANAAKPAGGGPAASLGLGAPPSMPGLPPPPTGVGAMPTGDPSTTKKAAADQAILALREVKGHYPQLGQMLDATVDALKAVARPEAPPESGAPVPPGAPTAPVTPVMDSGSEGP